MPFILIPLLVGAALGGATVWKLSDTSKQIATAGVVVGLGYVAWVNRSSITKLLKV